MTIAAFVVALISAVFAGCAALAACRSAHASKRSADAAARMVDLAEKEHVKQSRPRLYFEAKNQRELRIGNMGIEHLTLVSVQFEEHPVTPCNDRLAPPPQEERFGPPVEKPIPPELVSAHTEFDAVVVIDDMRYEHWEFRLTIDAECKRVRQVHVRTLGRALPT